jgi:predicted dehydrogenase
MNRSSRRHFVRQLSLGVGALSAISPSLAKSALPKGPAEKKLGVALVGLGSYSEHRLAPALADTQFCQLAGIVTGTPAKAERWAQKYNLPKANVYNYQNFDQIADNPAIDIVYVVLPNSMHHEFTVRAAKAGKHVICEKPMSVSVKEAEAMIAACKAAGKQLGIGYRLHFEPHTKEIMRLAREKDFGEIRHVETNFGFAIGNPAQWRLKKALSGGGPLMDVGIYCIQAARYATGLEPVAVTAQAFKTNPTKFAEVEETLTWQLEFPGGLVANGSTSYAFGFERLRVTADQGFYELSPAYGYGPIKGRTSKGELNLPHTWHQVAQLDAFAEFVRQNRPTTVPGEEGLRDMKIIEAIYQSVDTGRRIVLGS